MGSRSRGTCSPSPSAKATAGHRRRHPPPARRTRRVVASFWQIPAKCCSFSAVSAPIFARKYAFCSIFQNLPDYLAEIFEIWQNFANFATFAKVLQIFTKIADFSNRFFAKILRLQWSSVHVCTPFSRNPQALLMRLDSFFSGALCVLSGGRLPEALFMVFLLDSKGAKVFPSFESA